MGWAVWSHHMFTVGLGPIANAAFSITTMAIAIPTGVKIFNWIATMWKGQIRFTAPMLFAIGFISMFIIGGLSGMMHAVAPSDAQQQDTYFIVAHIHYVLFGGSIFALIAGLYYWYPKITGRLMSEKLGKLNFFLTFVGFNLTFFPMHFLGLEGMPRRIYTYDSGFGFDLWNFVATIGALILGLSILSLLHNMFWSKRKGKIAGNDPWNARTLEWSIPSPPPDYNFASIPTVDKLDHFWYSKQKQLKNELPSETSDDETNIHMPSPSFFPFIVSLGIVIAAYGLMYNIPVAIIGVLITIIGIYAWSFEPPTEDSH